MFELPHTPATEESVSIQPSLFLEYGLDGTSGDDAACEVCERGMRFKSRWQFDLGAMLQIAFLFEGETAAHRSSRIEAEGMVIECKQEGDRTHLTTLSFLEPPKELRTLLGKFSPGRLTRPSPPSE